MTTDGTPYFNRDCEFVRGCGAEVDCRQYTVRRNEWCQSCLWLAQMERNDEMAAAEQTPGA